ncbi:MAG TPA: hypothetical protein VD906_14885, partial [Caulobacteraceae bacterium]|nr:hypothetical protein [Caulobacteraceae bacterium]
VSSFRIEYNLVSIEDDRYGTIYPVPREHLGRTVMDSSPVGVGRLAIEYYCGLIGEAARRFV